MITTQRLCLRPLRTEDIEQLLALDNDRQVMRWLNGGTPVSRIEMQDQILPRLLVAAERPPRIGVHIAQLRDTAAFIGWFGIFPPVPPRELPRFGARLSPHAWGIGLGLEGARALIDHTFSTTDIPAIEATTYEETLASRSLLQRLGFIETERFRYQPDQATDA
ncbi:MAG: GNAT family N-acetyltransferase [Gammaproteobacteria bacterium]|nr:GNAT family N-acetyltransferase [Gammaproteobacteria bacterium]